jgi:hypothetical protein
VLALLAVMLAVVLVVVVVLQYVSHRSAHAHAEENGAKHYLRGKRACVCVLPRTLVCVCVRACVRACMRVTRVCLRVRLFAGCTRVCLLPYCNTIPVAPWPSASLAPTATGRTQTSTLPHRLRLLLLCLRPPWLFSHRLIASDFRTPAPTVVILPAAALAALAGAA